MPRHDLPDAVEFVAAILCVLRARLDLRPVLAHVLAHADGWPENEVRRAREDPLATPAVAEQAVYLPPIQVRPRHLPVLAVGVSVKEERPSRGAHQHRNFVSVVRHACLPPLSMSTEYRVPSTKCAVGTFKRDLCLVVG